ncbi:MAG: hypothetical protein SOT20_06145, partial [Candidatus Cryptobacteroides sp.]|nr:hypothetical protein [Candidatus Cryptobacteroides sp.]
MRRNFLILIYLLFAIDFEFSAQEFNAPRSAEDYQMVTHDGAWCWFSDPRAIYVDDKIFGGFVDKEGSIWAFSYDPA